MDLTWHDLHHTDLTVADLHDVLALRNRVFVVEQECAYQDVDGLDLVRDTRHLLARAGFTAPDASGAGSGAGSDSEADGAIVGYARLLAPYDGRPARIGRVIVTAEARGRRLGARLMERALASCAQHWPGAGGEISAQDHHVGFYTALGFVVTSEVYDDDGIPHQDMRLP